MNKKLQQQIEFVKNSQRIKMNCISVTKQIMKDVIDMPGVKYSYTHTHENIDTRVWVPPMRSVDGWIRYDNPLYYDANSWLNYLKEVKEEILSKQLIS